jgi:hypothetical protein
MLFKDGTRTLVTLTALLVIVAIVTLAVLLVQSGSETRIVVRGQSATGVTGQSTTGWVPPTQPEHIESEAELQQYVLSRSIWQSKPLLYAASIRFAFTEPEDSGAPKVAVVDEQGNAKAYSVAQLLAEGSHLAGEQIYVVGRVMSSVASTAHTDVPWTVSPVADDEISGPHNVGRIYALALGPPSSEGEVVYFRAVVAAVGAASGPRPATYIIGLETPRRAEAFSEPGTNIEGLVKKLGH